MMRNYHTVERVDGGLGFCADCRNWFRSVEHLKVGDEATGTPI